MDLPAYLFGPEGEMELVNSEQAYQALWQGGWRDKPTIETHPARVVTTVRESVMPKNDPQQVLDDQAKQSLLELQNFALALHGKHEAQTEQVNKLTEQTSQHADWLTELRTHAHQAMQMVSGLAERVTHLEAARHPHREAEERKK